MCRVLFARAQDEGVNTLGSLIHLHYKASAEDPLLAELTGGDGRHCHGFGAALLVDQGRGWELHYYRYDAYDYTRDYEDSCRLNLEMLQEYSRRLAEVVTKARRVLLLLHSRRASRGMPRGVLNTHPFNAGIAREKSYGELYLAHNGSVLADAVAEELGLDPKSYTDSHLITLWIARRIREGAGLLEAVEEGARFVKRAYVIGSLLVGLGGEPLLAYAGVLARGLDDARKRYYTPYLAYGEGLRALVSPTIKMYAEEAGLEVEYEDAGGVGLL
ncbi:MAG: class II glutamine amidotransferase [Desulfurococcales archaeon]|nr:class II glutamine amidotransferase [Desulfurococcales archaeon]